MAAMATTVAATVVTVNARTRTVLWWPLRASAASDSDADTSATCSAIACRSSFSRSIVYPLRRSSPRRHVPVPAPYLPYFRLAHLRLAHLRAVAAGPPPADPPAN